MRRFEKDIRSKLSIGEKDMTKETPKVSVVIPVYNAEKYLHKCLGTVCRQTLRDIEIICIDDGSVDDSLVILEEYAKQDVRFRILNHPHCDGIGAAGARNVGIEAACGEYIIFLDADDYFDVELLEKTYKKAKQCDADLVMYDAVRFDDDTGEVLLDFSHLNRTLMPREDVFSWRDYPDYFFQVSGSAPWTQLIRRRCIEEHNLKFQEVYPLDDFFFTYASRLSAERVVILNDKLVYYRNNGNNSQTSKMLQGALSIDSALKMKKWLDEQGLFEKFKQSFFERIINIIKWYLRSGQDIEIFTGLFDLLKSSALRELGLLEADEEDFIDPEKYEWCKKVAGLNLLEYLHWEYTRTRMKKKVSVPNTFRTEDRVILYGAGVQGRSFFVRNIINQFCHIVQWVDRDYKNFADQVESPDNIGKVSFDKVIIAVENETAYEQIVKKLQSLGVEEENIIWLFEDKKDV